MKKMKKKMKKKIQEGRNADSKVFGQS